MPRSRRIIVPDAPHHVIQRGHNRDRCFFADGDYSLYLALLREYARQHGCSVHAYVLMSNHVHLLLTPSSETGISEMLRRVHQRYVQSVNRRNSRCGSAWQGRFRVSLVDSQSYFMNCQRYIEMNPVRARMVKRPDEYRWSSHRHHAIGEPCPLLTLHPAFLALGDAEEARRTAYRALFSIEMSDELIQRIRIAAAGCRPLGDDAFIESLRAHHGNFVTRQRPGPKPAAAGAARQHQMF